MFTLNVRLAQLQKGRNIIKQNAEDIDWEVTVNCLGGLENVFITVKGAITGVVYRQI